jgi:hypothetical protein
MPKSKRRGPAKHRGSPQTKGALHFDAGDGVGEDAVRWRNGYVRQQTADCTGCGGATLSRTVGASPEERRPCEIDDDGDSDRGPGCAHTVQLFLGGEDEHLRTADVCWVDIKNLQAGEPRYRAASRWSGRHPSPGLGQAIYCRRRNGRFARHYNL